MNWQNKVLRSTYKHVSLLANSDRWHYTARHRSVLSYGENDFWEAESNLEAKTFTLFHTFCQFSRKFSLSAFLYISSMVKNAPIFPDGHLDSLNVWRVNLTLTRYFHRQAPSVHFSFSFFSELLSSSFFEWRRVFVFDSTMILWNFLVTPLLLW